MPVMQDAPHKSTSMAYFGAKPDSECILLIIHVLLKAEKAAYGQSESTGLTKKQSTWDHATALCLRWIMYVMSEAASSAMSGLAR